MSQRHGGEEGYRDAVHAGGHGRLGPVSGRLLDELGATTGWQSNHARKAPRLRTGQVRQVRSLRRRATDRRPNLALDRLPATAPIYLALHQGFLDDGARHRSLNPPTPAIYRRQNPAGYRCDSQVTVKRRKEIAGIVTV